MNPALASVSAPHPVKCPWCGIEFDARPGPKCTQCGGPLPLVAQGDRGEPPPETPRMLPAAFRRQVLFTKNVGVIVGLVFMVVGVPLIPLFGFGLIFAGVGYVVWRKGRTSAKDEIRVLETGVKAEGEISGVEVDTSEAINGRNPWRVEFVFTVDGRQHAGSVKTWCPSSGYRQRGEPVWVVYDPQNPEVSSLWPPLA